MNINIKKLIIGIIGVMGAIIFLSTVISFIAFFLTINSDWGLRSAISLGALIIYSAVFLIILDLS